MSKVDDGVPICSHCQILCLERFKYSTHVFFKMYRFTFLYFIISEERIECIDRQMYHTLIKSFSILRSPKLTPKLPITI